MEFLKELKENNNRDWFQAHKQDYLDHIVEPAKLFVSEFGERLMEISSEFIADPRTNGSGSLMRIYRDIRFSKDKAPYNTQVRLIFWEGEGKKMERPGIYFCFDPNGGQIYSGMHVFPKPTLEIFRDAVIDEGMGPALEHALAKIGNAGKKPGEYMIGGEQYKGVPREFDPLHDRAYLLKYKGLYAGGPHIPPKALGSEKLLDICVDQCTNLAPLHHWLVKMDGIGSAM